MLDTSIHPNLLFTPFSMPNNSSNKVTDIGSTSSRDIGTTLVMESPESTRNNTNWYHIWALLAILLDYVSIIFNVFPVNTNLENSSSNSPSMISNGNSIMNNNSNDELMVHSNNNNRSDLMVQPSSPSFSNQSSPTNKNRLDVFASEFYSSLFASGGIESNEDFEKMVYSMSGHLLSRHNSIYSQNEYSDDEGTTEATYSSFTRTNSTVHNQTNTDLERYYPEESNRPELDILQSDLNLFKFPTTNI